MQLIYHISKKAAFSSKYTVGNIRRKLFIGFGKLSGNFICKSQNFSFQSVGINLHLENINDKNISILAEKLMALTDKLNQAIKVSDKTLLYEVQVNLLTSKIDRLGKEIAEIKNKIA